MSWTKCGRNHERDPDCADEHFSGTSQPCRMLCRDQSLANTGEAEHVCALPALRLTQPHAAPEVVAASLANEISGRLTPFNGPKVHSSPDAGHPSVDGCQTSLVVVARCHPENGMEFCIVEVTTTQTCKGTGAAPTTLSEVWYSADTLAISAEADNCLTGGACLQADVWAAGQILGQFLRTTSGHARAPAKQGSTPPSGLQKLISEMTADEPSARPSASQSLHRCCKLLQC